MVRSLFIAATGMEAQKLNLDVISNNLANANTVGFKRGRADFQELLYQTLRAPGTASGEGSQVPSGVQVGLGVKPVAIEKNFTQGNFVQTGNQLDLVIEGVGFFQVQLPDGATAYTRSGAFKLDSDGRIVNSDGYPLEPSVSIPADVLNISISADGMISVTQPGSTAPSEIGQVELARFINPAGLQAIGKNLFIPTGSSGDPTTGNPGTESMGNLNQGFVEMSNVSVVDEMVNMIISQRAYEFNSKAVQASDEMLQTANNLKR